MPPGLIDGDTFPSIPGFPDLPGFNAPDPDDDRPACHERGKCGAHPSHHHRPDFTGHRRCESATRRAGRSDHRTVQIDRSDDRSAHRRRSAVTERPQNARTVRAYTNSGGYNTRRSIPEARNPESRADDNQNRSYRGNHRAAGQHHLDHQTPAQQRSSRVGRHHADPHDDYISN